MEANEIARIFIYKPIDKEYIWDRIEGVNFSFRGIPEDDEVLVYDQKNKSLNNLDSKREYELELSNYIFFSYEAYDGLNNEIRESEEEFFKNKKLIEVINNYAEKNILSGYSMEYSSIVLHVAFNIYGVSSMTDCGAKHEVVTDYVGIIDMENLNIFKDVI